MKTAVIAVLCLLLARLPLAQEIPATEKKNCTVSGVVVKEPGSQPLKKAIVTLVAEDHEEGTNYTTTSDPEGRFALDNVRPGRYRVLLERTGYSEINARKRKTDGRTLSLTPGQELKDLRLTMLATATAFGRVVDEDGDPIADVEVTILRKPYGKSQWEPAGSERTNDLGEYRIAGLFPGRYYFSASPPPDYRGILNIESQSNATQQSELRCITTYYPNTTNRSQAVSLDLRPGDEMPVNFTMIPSRTFTVRGIISGLPPGKKAAVILQGREYGLTSNAAEVDKDSRFELRGVAPGSYWAVAFIDDENRSLRTSRQNIDVVSSDLEDVRLFLLPFGTVRGQLVADRGRPPSAYVVLRLLNEDEHPTHFFASGEMGAFLGARSAADGTFEIKEVPAGIYTVEIASGSKEWQDSFVQSIRLAGAPGDTGFAINGNAGPLLITLSSHSATIDGLVTDDTDKPFSDATIVAVPEDKFRKLPTRFGHARSDQNGRFIIHGLAPGDYTLYAWQNLEGELYLDPEFLKTQQDHGHPIHAEADKTTTVTLKVAVIPDEAQ